MSGPIALVLAAGKGTRMKSAQPKVLFPVLGRAIVQRVVDAAMDAGCADVVVVVGHGKEAVQRALPGLRFAEQSRMLGTGDAVMAARGAAPWQGRTVLILPGDVPLISAATLRTVLSAHHESAASVTVVTLLPPDPSGYGRVVRDADDQVLRIVEHRDATVDERRIAEVNSSIFAIDGTFLFGGPDHPPAIDELRTDNDQREYYLTDIVGVARSRGMAVRAVIIDDPDIAAGVNDRAQLAQIEAALRHRINHAHLLAGVSMDDPASTRIEEGVRIAPDVQLGADVELRGRTSLGEGVRVERGCVLTDVVVGPGSRLAPYVVATWADIDAGVEVRPFSVLTGVHEKDPAKTGPHDQVRVGPNARVGPFSHLRQSSTLASDVHVGNFVEIKNTHMDPGSKANHLAYLGDADIGARSNVGAGVITCNYDGFGKYRTVLEEDVFVGTDSQLIAPIRVGRGAYVGTGTTLTRDVPADALAIGRARQENKQGYAPRIRAQLKARADASKKA